MKTEKILSMTMVVIGGFMVGFLAKSQIYATIPVWVAVIAIGTAFYKSADLDERRQK